MNLKKFWDGSSSFEYIVDVPIEECLARFEHYQDSNHFSFLKKAIISISEVKVPSIYRIKARQGFAIINAQLEDTGESTHINYQMNFDWIIFLMVIGVPSLLLCSPQLNLLNYFSFSVIVSLLLAIFGFNAWMSAIILDNQFKNILFSEIKQKHS